MVQISKLRKADWFIGIPLAIALAPIARLARLVLRRNHTFEAPKQIVVLKLLGGGNFALAMPLILGLRRSFPHSKLTAVVTPSTAAFADAIGLFDDKIVIETRSILGLLFSGARALYAIFRIDVIVDLEIHSKITTCFGALTMARNRVGLFTNDFFLRKYLYTHLVYFNPIALRVDCFKQLISLMGGKSASFEECHEHLRDILGNLSTSTGVAAIGVGCSDLGAVRKLSAEQWLRVLRAGFKKRGVRSALFLGAAGDSGDAEKIIQLLEREFPEVELVNLCGQLSLRESLARLSECACFWGIDSALLHFARLLKVPSESFWGPTNPATLLAQIPGLSEEIHYRPISCSPCIHVAETAPCHGRNLCIQGLFEPDEIPVEVVMKNTSFYP